ncbi:hypothetical protein SAMN04487931_103349 [Desulfobacula phenolica]|uniref:Uncharacterized protein n=1 Tax=Desulfobacula phenolica TaxID=90732 RepID=A0A1H2EU44_9BACT|nr:hypothetical protein SAMN04487931_103349 [Desulfobacula phenolica]
MQNGINMKFFPIKIAIICLLITPVFYIVTLELCEKYLNKNYSCQIENILIGDSIHLLDGSVRLEEQIANNIHDFCKADWLIQKAKLDINILVTTIHKKIIYPIFLDVDSLAKDINSEFDSENIAKNNFEILNGGLVVKIETNLSHGSRIGNIVLVLYFGVSFFIFFVFYKIASAKSIVEGETKAQLINDLKREEQIHKQMLKNFQKERHELFENIKVLNKKYQKDKTKAKINEEEMFEEIISLEEKLNSFIELKQKKEMEISELKSKIQKHGKKKNFKLRHNELEFIEKRFSALYKNIKMNKKALSGFLNLSDELQIKAEEIIHLLDRNPDKIIIKRKVFSGKKHRTACFEVLFSYNGRLYFKKNENNITEVLVVGTKKTQTKDIEFIHKL